MALGKDIYSALEDVVGPEYICDDPVIMPSYHATEFAAVLLPANTAQVQAIVKLCNKHKLQFRPVCTGWTGKFQPGILYLDLRRMNFAEVTVVGTRVYLPVDILASIALLASGKIAAKSLVSTHTLEECPDLMAELSGGESRRMKPVFLMD